MMISSVEYRVSKDEINTSSCSLFSQSGSHSVVRRNLTLKAATARGKTPTTCSFLAMFSGATASHHGSGSRLKVGGGPWNQYANSINKPCNEPEDARRLVDMNRFSCFSLPQDNLVLYREHCSLLIDVAS